MDSEIAKRIVENWICGFAYYPYILKIEWFSDRYVLFKIPGHTASLGRSRTVYAKVQWVLAKWDCERKHKNHMSLEDESIRYREGRLSVQEQADWMMWAYQEGNTQALNEG